VTTPAEATATTQRPTYRPSQVRRDGDYVVLSIPMTFRRRNGRREIILPQGADGIAAPQPAPNRSLVLALARAWRWQEMLDSGEVTSVDELAKRLHLDPTYVARTLRLATLAPGLVEEILAGKEPSGLSQRKLSAQIPPNWHEQQQLFGPSVIHCW
jgi:ParB-like chromosome segregation protein Spo0J